MPTYEQLMTRHPLCGVGEMGLLRALYKGGREFEAQIRKLLPQRPGEDNSRYQLRLKEARYRNYIGPIVDFFTAMLFSTRALVGAKSEETGETVDEPEEFYGRFYDNCDRKGTKVDAVFKTALTDAMVDGYSWVLVSHPPLRAVESRAEFDQLELGECWIEPVEADEVLDWKDSETGLDWAVRYTQKSEREDISSDRSQLVETWKVYYRDRIDTYQLVRDAKKKPQPKEEVARISTEPHGFGKVPLVCLDMPPALHVAERLKDPQLSHFRMSCALSWSMATTCYATVVMSLADPERAPSLSAGKGIILGLNEGIDYAAPPTEHFSALADEISAEKDEIFRIANQMALGVENNAAAVGRSGESKQIDAQATRVAMIAYSRLVKEAIENVYDLISAYREDGYDWNIGGLDDFAAADIYGLIDAYTKVGEAGGVPSDTFNAEMLCRIAEALLADLPQATKTAIRAEVTAGVKKRGEEETQIGQMVNELRGQKQRNGAPIQENALA